MNDGKTEFIIFGSRQYVVSMDINVNGAIVSKISCIKYLGADLDERMSLKDIPKMEGCHGKPVKAGAQKKIPNPGCDHNSCTRSCANALYSGLPKSETRKLQRIQSMAAKIVTKFDSSTAALKLLHWLPINLRIKFKVLTLVFRAVHKLTPTYLTELIIPATTRREGLCSQSTAFTPSVPFTKCKIFAGRPFSVLGPRSWNALLDDLCSLTDYNVFKAKLKTNWFKDF